MLPSNRPNLGLIATERVGYQAEVRRRYANPHPTAPSVCQAFEGKVGAQGFFNGMVITSPNMDYVPEYPVERRVIETYADGRWGLREYSRWPQMLVPDMMHIACIPRAPTVESHDVLWETLLPNSSWEEDLLTGVRDLGYVKKEIRTRLTTAAEWQISRFQLNENTTQDRPEDYCEHGAVLVTILRQALERMNLLPSGSETSIAVAAHVQRVSLELAGLSTYLEVVHRRLRGGLDHSSDVLPVVGTFVREGTGAQTCTRIGLPTWFLQPMTNTVKIWRTVGFESLPADMSGTRCDPPVYHEDGAVAGIANLTGNWLRVMALAVSKLLCGTHVPELHAAETPAVMSVEEQGSDGKRARIEGADAQAKHLGMRPVVGGSNAGEKPKKSRRDRKRLKTAANNLTSATDGQPADAGPAADSPANPCQPSRSFVASPFYSVPESWARALQEVSPVPRVAASALYFFPPPFLLDTVSSQLPPPADCVCPAAARNDDKILRYLHNHLRIRRFCRTRLFDPMMSSTPLTIADWRAALWGEFSEKEGGATGGSAAHIRRHKRRREEWNAICRLFGRVALLPSYREDRKASFRGKDFAAKDLVEAHDVRRWVLWESHEINFRCEVMALDTYLVQRKDWQEIHRWNRETAVSAIWGRSASVLSVLPADDLPEQADRWMSASHSDWRTCCDYLVAFVNVMLRWPAFPESLLGAVAEVSDWDEARYRTVCDEAVTFYVKTFVRVYQRLPTPPIPSVVR